MKKVMVPVVDKNNKPLMPTSCWRASKWIKSRKATPFWKHGIFCVRLNVEPSARNMQPIAVGIDPGSKREAFTVKSKKNTYVNILTHAVTHVKDVMEDRKSARKSRRFRKTPYRKQRKNRKMGGLPPSTKARWQLKLRVINKLIKIFPISQFVVENIKAVTTGQKRWDSNFSPLGAGKKWFYGELRKIAPVKLMQGWETCNLRNRLGLEKTYSKLDEKFSVHNVDSWTLAWSGVGGKEKPDNESLLILVSLRFHRRQLHYCNFFKGGKRRLYGGTRSLGLKRGSLVDHSEYGLCYVGGSSKGMISLHSLVDGCRIYQKVKLKDIKFKCYSSFRFYTEKDITDPFVA